MEKALTLGEIATMETETLTADQVASLLGFNPHSIRVQAKSAPEKLGFPVICAGKRVKIPRRPFLKFMQGHAAE